MRLLTKLELDKLIRRKYLLLGGLLLLGYSSFMFFSCCMNSSPTFPVETADGVEVTGRAAALYNKSVYEQYAGELTDEAVAHVLDDFVDCGMLMGNIRLTGLSFMTISQFFELLIRLTVSVQNMDISALLMRESYPFIRL